jgi:hypothetical protein
MKRSILTKSLIFVAVACLALALMPPGIAQQPKNDPAKPGPAKPEPTQTARPKVEMGAMTAEEMQAIDMKHAIDARNGVVPKWVLSKGFRAATSIQKFDVTASDGVATVFAVSSLRDRREGMNYIWRLKVSTTDGKTLAKRNYDKEIFSVPVSGELAEPVFFDTIDLPPGESIVELALFAFHKRVDPGILNDEETAKGYSAGSAWRKVKN